MTQSRYDARQGRVRRDRDETADFGYYLAYASEKAVARLRTDDVRAAMAQGEAVIGDACSDWTMSIFGTKREFGQGHL